MLVDYNFNKKEIKGAEVKLENLRRVGTNHSAWVHLIKDNVKVESFFVSSDTPDTTRSSEELIIERIKGLSFLSNFVTDQTVVEEIKSETTTKKKGRGKKNSA